MATIEAPVEHTTQLALAEASATNVQTALMVVAVSQLKGGGAASAFGVVWIATASGALQRTLDGGRVAVATLPHR